MLKNFIPWYADIIFWLVIVYIVYVLIYPALSEQRAEDYAKKRWYKHLKKREKK